MTKQLWCQHPEGALPSRNNEGGGQSRNCEGSPWCRRHPSIQSSTSVWHSCRRTWSGLNLDFAIYSLVIATIQCCWLKSPNTTTFCCQKRFTTKRWESMKSMGQKFGEVIYFNCFLHRIVLAWNTYISQDTLVQRKPDTDKHSPCS